MPFTGNHNYISRIISIMKIITIISPSTTKKYKHLILARELHYQFFFYFFIILLSFLTQEFLNEGIRPLSVNNCVPS